MKASSGINRNGEALDSPAKMKKIVTFIVLLVFVTLNCQCRRDEDPNTRLAVYLEENESQLELLRGWSILYVPDRGSWWCRHYCSRDSLLSFVLVRVDKHDRITFCEVNPLFEDSIVAAQTAKQNVSTLYGIKHIYGYKFMGAHEVELFRDSFEYDFFIATGDENTHLTIMLKSSENDTTDLHLYKNWYLRKNCANSTDP